jgi:hypothetical protein
MQVTIGMRSSARDLTLEVELDEAEFAGQVETALKDGSTLQVTDSKQRRYFVPAEAIGFVQVGAPTERTVGVGVA